MGTRTYSRRASDGTRVLTAAGRRRIAESIASYSLSVYADNRIYNPELLPMDVQTEIRKAYESLDTIAGDTTSENYASLSDMMSEIKLDIDNPDDRRIFADFNGIFGTLSNEDLGAVMGFGYDLGFSSQYVNSANRTTMVDSQTYHIILKNEHFILRNDAPQGIGFAMIARQLTAARELVRRTNYNVYIETDATTKYDGGNLPMVGTLVWPKMGYRGYLPSMRIGNKSGEIVELLRQRGFTGDALEYTDALMLSTSEETGESGYDAWTAIMSNISQDSSIRMSVSITTDNVDSDTFSLAEQVSRGYARRKGFAKTAPPASGDGASWFTDDDDMVLREVWQELRGTKKR